MVHDVLQSDVEFARGLMAANQSEKEILAALCLRGVDAEKAARLLSALRSNLPVQGTIAPPMPLHRHASRPSAVPSENQASAEPHRGERRSHHHRRSIPWWFLIIVGIFIWALAYCLLHEENIPTDYEKHDIPAKPSSRNFNEKR